MVRVVLRVVAARQVEAGQPARPGAYSGRRSAPTRRMRRTAVRPAAKCAPDRRPVVAERGDAAHAGDHDRRLTAMPSIDRNHLARDVAGTRRSRGSPPPPRLPRGARRGASESSSSISSSGTPSIISVSISPGATQLTVMSRLASSSASALVAPMIAGLGGAVVHLAAIAHEARDRRERHDRGRAAAPRPSA